MCTTWRWTDFRYTGRYIPITNVVSDVKFKCLCQHTHVYHMKVNWFQIYRTIYTNNQCGIWCKVQMFVPAYTCVPHEGELSHHCVGLCCEGIMPQHCEARCCGKDDASTVPSYHSHFNPPSCHGWLPIPSCAGSLAGDVWYQVSLNCGLLCFRLRMTSIYSCMSSTAQGSLQ